MVHSISSRSAYRSIDVPHQADSVRPTFVRQGNAGNGAADAMTRPPSSVREEIQMRTQIVRAFHSLAGSTLHVFDMDGLRTVVSGSRNALEIASENFTVRIDRGEAIVTRGSRNPEHLLAVLKATQAALARTTT